MKYLLILYFLAGFASGIVISEADGFLKILG